MGGSGSGRRGGRDLTAHYRRLDVRELHRAGVLVPGWRGGWNWYRNGQKRASVEIEVGDASIRLRYRATDRGEWKDYDYTVRLSRSSCHYGGERPWFLCPCCGRRVAILYGGAVFACRHCYRLAYESQRERDYDRLAGRADKIRRRLGWPVGILNPTPWTKPKGMHWRTFWRLKAEHDRLRGVGMDGSARQLGIVERRLDGIRR